MIKEKFNRCYLAFYRGYDNHPCLRKFGASQEAASLMAYMLTMNVLSFAIFTNKNIFIYGLIPVIIIAFIVFGSLLQIAIMIIYNKKRREILIKSYENEDYMSRRRAAVGAWVYVICSVLLLIAAFSIYEFPQLLIL